jgi:hypothetical protein
MKKIRISWRRIFQSHEGREKRKFFFGLETTLSKRRELRESVCALKRVTFFLSSLSKRHRSRKERCVSLPLSRDSLGVVLSECGLTDVLSFLFSLSFIKTG